MAKTAELELIGRNVRSIRESNRLTQAELAELANLSVDFVSGIERGVLSASIGSLSRLASALQVTLVDFFARERDADSDSFDELLGSLVDSLRRSGAVHDLEFLRSIMDALSIYRARLQPSGD